MQKNYIWEIFRGIAALLLKKGVSYLILTRVNLSKSLWHQKALRLYA